MVTHRQRMEKCLSGEKPDRTPVALWRHFPVDDQTAEGLAAATVHFQRTFDFDLVKISPESSFCLQDWGVKDEWRGATEGTRTYTGHVIHDAEDWERLAVLNPKKGRLGAQIDALRLIGEELGNDTPIIQTIFSPLHQAKNLAGNDRLLFHIRRYPEAVLAGLRTILESTQLFIEAIADSGIDGIFYAVHYAQYALLSSDEFTRFGRDYDLQALEPARRFHFNMLHVHGVNIMFDLVRGYPVQMINWHDRETYPSLSKAKELFPGIVCGGLQREKTMVLGDPEAVTKEAKQAIEETAGRRFILGTGCVLPIIAPHGNIMAARQSVELEL